VKYFGTDGIRGKFGVAPIDGDFFQKLAHTLEIVFSKNRKRGKLKVCIGRDTRASGAVLFEAMVRGFSSKAKVLDCEILPTAAIAEATIFSKSDLGIAITASHNPGSDNGIKIFNGNGEKLTVELEEEIERAFDSTGNVAQQSSEVVDFHSKARRHYCSKYKNFLAKGALRGRTVVVDSANGATCGVVGEILEAFGAKVIQIGNSPNGENINDGCGSEHTENLAAAMDELKAFVGFAYDGDGDRVVIFDGTGERVDGDILIGAIADHMASTGALTNGTITVTTQSNLGLDRYCNSVGVNVIRCNVGDRNVYWSMVESGCNFGGENSGHLIFRQFSPIGDGITSALYVLSILIEKGTSFTELKRKIALLPQKSFNVSVDRKVPVSDIKNLSDDIEKVKAQLANPNRIVTRYSGTESKLRILIEGPDEASVDSAWSDLKKSIIERMCENGISASIS
jgi:phosphoglucosamine mutase